MKKTFGLAILAGILSLNSHSQTQEITLESSKNNSIYEEGILSNGAGESIFTGTIRTGWKRLALRAFDLSGAVPAATTGRCITNHLGG